MADTDSIFDRLSQQAAQRKQVQAPPVQPAQPSSDSIFDRLSRRVGPKQAFPQPSAPINPTAPTAPTNGAGGATSPNRGILNLPQVWQRVHRENFDDMNEEWKDAWKGDTFLGKTWGTIKALGASADYLASPVQALGETLLGEPAETATGLKGLAKKVGEWTGFTAQLAVDPLSVVGKGVEVARASKLGEGIEKAVSPTSRTVVVPKTDLTTGKPIPGTVASRQPWPKRVSEIISKWESARMLSGARAAYRLEGFRKLVGQMPDDVRIDFMKHMSGEPTATPLPTGLQPLADELRAQLDERTAKLQSLGLLQNAQADYWPRLWKNPDAASQVYHEWNTGATAASKSPIRGSRGAAGLKQRTLPTIQEGLDRGLELKTTNPIDMAIERMAGSDKWFYGTHLSNEMKQLPYVKFFKWNKEADARAQGLVKLNDEVFQPRLMPASVSKTFRAIAQHYEAFDPVIRQGLHNVANFIGAKISKPLTDAILKQGTIGYAMRQGGKTVGRFGTNDAVLMHEIGHQLDFKYGLANLFQQAPRAWKELEDLALKRTSGPTTPAFTKYLLNPTERIANLFHAYWHAPELLHSVAPNAERVLRTFLNSNPALRQVVDSVKSSVEIAAEERPEVFEEHLEKYFPGVRQLGAYWAPEPVSTVFNNYASKGWRDNAIYNAVRQGGNALNMAQLSLSAFHYMMVSIDATANRLATLPRQIAGKNVAGLAHTGVSSIPLIGPVIGGGMTAYKGKKFYEALMNPGNTTPHMAKLVEAFQRAGGRVDMDRMFHADVSGGFFKAIRSGYLADAINQTVKEVKTTTPVARQVLQGMRLASRTIETSIEPIMASYVPNVKLGVFHDMASDWLKANPLASGQEMSVAMTKIWDNIDDRLGQMVYDNLFWNKTLKDTAFLFVRAVGWNLGTERALGGGAWDLAKNVHGFLTGTKDNLEITDRTRYSVAMITTAAIQGATLTYLLTGQGPQSLMDYFYPRTGKMTKEGVPERVSMPTYIKDMVSYNNAPVQTILNKLHPLFEVGQELIKNQDYYGGIIVDPQDPRGIPPQLAEYFQSVFTPFSIRGMFRQAQEGADILPMIMNAFGFVPAPLSVTNPLKTERFEEQLRRKAVRRRKREEATGVR